MMHGDTCSRTYKRKRAKALLNTGDFSQWVSDGDWGYYPSHRHWRKVDLRYRKPKSVK